MHCVRDSKSSVYLVVVACRVFLKQGPPPPPPPPPRPVEDIVLQGNMHTTLQQNISLRPELGSTKVKAAC